MGKRVNSANNGQRAKIGSARQSTRRIGSARSTEGYTRPSININRPSSAPVSSRTSANNYRPFSAGKSSKIAPSSNDIFNELKVEGKAIQSTACQSSVVSNKGNLRILPNYRNQQLRRKSCQHEHGHNLRPQHIPYIFVSGNERPMIQNGCRSFEIQERMDNESFITNWASEYSLERHQYLPSETSDNEDDIFLAESPDSANIPALHFQESISSEEHDLLVKSPTSSRTSSGTRSPICLVSKSGFRKGGRSYSTGGNGLSKDPRYDNDVPISRVNKKVKSINVEKLLKLSETDSNDEASESTIVSLGQKIKQMATRSDDQGSDQSGLDDNQKESLADAEENNWDSEWQQMLHLNHTLLLQQEESPPSSTTAANESSEEEGERNKTSHSRDQLPNYSSNKDVPQSHSHMATIKQTCFLEDIEEEEVVSSSEEDEESFHTVKEIKPTECKIDSKDIDVGIKSEDKLPNMEEDLVRSHEGESNSLVLKNTPSFRLSVDLTADEKVQKNSELTPHCFRTKIENASCVPSATSNAASYSKPYSNNFLSGSYDLSNQSAGTFLSSFGYLKPQDSKTPISWTGLPNAGPKLFISPKVKKNCSSDLSDAIKLIENEEKKDKSRVYFRAEKEVDERLKGKSTQVFDRKISKPEQNKIPKETEELDLNILSEKILIFAEEIETSIKKQPEQNKDDESLRRILKSEQILEEICFREKKKVEPRDEPALHRQCETKLTKKQRELEDRIQKNLDLIRKLLDDKRELTDKCEKISIELNTNERRHFDKVKLLDDKHNLEIKSVKERLTNDEQTRREKWTQQKAKMIKDSSFRSIETKMKEQVTQHREEVSKLKEEHWTQHREAEEKWIQKFRDLEEHWKDKMENEKQEQINRERERGKERYDHELHQSDVVWQSRLDNLNKQNARSKLEKDEETQRIMNRMKTEHEDQIHGHKREVDTTRDEFEEKLRTTLRAHENELSTQRLTNDKTQKEWRDLIVKDYEELKSKSEKELRERLRRQRDKEIEKAIKEIQQETKHQIDENKNTTDNKVKSLRERYETEMGELEASERISRTRYLEMKGALVQKEEENVYLRARLHTQSLEITDFQQMFQMQH